MDEGKIKKIAEISAVLAIVSCIIGARERPVLKHVSILTGDLYYEEIINSDNGHRFREVTRMDKLTFRKLLRVLQTNGNLQDSLKVKAGDKLKIFISALTHWVYRSRNLRKMAAQREHNIKDFA